MSGREMLGWTIAGLAIASFLAVEVFILSAVLDTVRDLNERTWALECEVRSADPERTP